MKWNLVFFPGEGERLSPFDYIAELPNESEQGQIIHRLNVLQNLEYSDWPHWTKNIVDKINQLTVGKHRLYYCLDGRTIVILHACRKRSAKAKKQDIRRAQKHYEEYFS